MPPIVRSNKMTLRLSDEEEQLRDALAAHLGTDASGVMRQALLKLAREERVVIPEQKSKPAKSKTR